MPEQGRKYLEEIEIPEDEKCILKLRKSQRPIAEFDRTGFGPFLIKFNRTQTIDQTITIPDGVVARYPMGEGGSLGISESGKITVTGTGCLKIYEI